MKRFVAYAGRKMIQAGVKQTKEKWKDHWITPPEIWERLAKTGFQWWDPCPVRPSFDGLATDWPHYCYINPPFSQYLKWVEYGLKQRTGQVWMANSATETRYYQLLLKNCSLLVFPKKRIGFIDPRTGRPTSDNYRGQTIFFRGNQENRDRFLIEFRDMGHYIGL